jgi:hypothetical protein
MILSKLTPKILTIQGHNGLFLAACGERSDNVTMPELAEALAIRRCVAFAQEEGFSKIILERFQRGS